MKLTNKQILFGCLICITAMACSKTPSYTYQKRSSSKTTQPTRTNASKPKTTLVNFRPTTSLQKALERAEINGKSVFIDFYTDYCPPCKIMDSEVFNDPALARYLNDNFINLKVDGAQLNGANIASLYRVSAFPTFIFVDNKGNELIRREGGTTIQTIKSMATHALGSTASSNTRK